VPRAVGGSAAISRSFLFMSRAATMAHLGSVFVVLSLFLPIVGAPLIAALQQQQSVAMPAGFSIFDLARLQGVGSISWHALLILAIGCIAALMAFTGPHRGLWLPSGLWMIGIAVELRILARQVSVMNAGGADDSILRAAITPWGWAAAMIGAVLMVVSGLAAHKQPR